MLTAKIITEQCSALSSVQELYEKSFPENERSPLELLLRDTSNCSEILAFYDDDKFCGFLSLLTHLDITHIIYFAVDNNLQGRGYGSAILNHLRKLKPNHRLIADLEVETENSQNNTQRSKRRQFYIKNGYKVSPVAYDWQDDSYEILIHGDDSLTDKEFWGFWEDITSLNPDFMEF